MLEPRPVEMEPIGGLDAFVRRCLAEGNAAELLTRLVDHRYFPRSVERIRQLVIS